ncbi:MAG: 4-(cytidine 5'-diphospho)-2-C-methyl-D-erythritol kinase [Clostridia bacterium]|nr:4-(cytidine 5'-diphospho)-2-C-methyl-D-erythritol kinase [Clostridia bacterium]
MKRAYRESAPAKINRFLHVTGVRTDGYHNLCSLMQTVSLCDEIRFEPGPEGSGLSFSCSVPELGGENNLCLTAANAFFEMTGRKPEGRMRLEKRIPHRAGLGGGSADAAAVLRLLRRVYSVPLTEEDILRTAAGIGADVPFCLHGGTALCEGIGDVLTPLPDPDPEIFLLAKGPEGLSTAEMFRLIDEAGTFSEPGEDGPGNDFEPYACRLLPGIRTLLDGLTASGAAEALMSGSGSAVFGRFSSESEARLAEKSLRAAFKAGSGDGTRLFTVVCRTVPRYD